MITSEKQIKGFTLLELLIVIAILSVLAMALILVLNPAETLKKSRDSQRMTDLATLKTALGLYLTNQVTPDLSNDSNVRCFGGSGTDTIFYSGSVTATGVAGGALNVGDANAGKGDVDGANGWIPINLTSLSSGAPISNFPLDPVNTEDADPITNDGLIYRYACKSDLTYEIDANLESAELGDKEDADGGNNGNLYETGTNLSILGATNDF